MEIFKSESLKDLDKIWMRLSIVDGIRFGFGLMLGGYMAMWFVKGLLTFLFLILDFILGTQSSNDLLL